MSVSCARGAQTYDFTRVGGGLLVQSRDRHNVEASDLRTVTRLKPSPEQLADLLFAWRVAKHVKSNAVVFCAGGRTPGTRPGQMSRIDAARVAAPKAHHAGPCPHGARVRSDASVPLRQTCHRL